ncbi:3-dehydroshikimate dehydratase [Streptococcus pneumoniae]|nr:3-dehydroshikimate dehydratase [Streptococcus pneumoniae]COL83166.1 3-dehydroshikimate dehydratase [Streptococcus pneumoniae]
MFEPNNVYAAAGSRIGMVPLFEGIVNYDEIIQEVRNTDLFASLEWFGHNSKEILKEEMKVLINRKLEVVTS